MCREIIIVANASQSLMAEASDRQHKLRADGACKCHLAAYALMNVEGMWLEVERHACEWCLGISCRFPPHGDCPLAILSLSNRQSSPLFEHWKRRDRVPALQDRHWTLKNGTFFWRSSPNGENAVGGIANDLHLGTTEARPMAAEMWRAMCVPEAMAARKRSGILAH